MILLLVMRERSYQKTSREGLDVDEGGRPDEVNTSSEAFEEQASLRFDHGWWLRMSLQL